MAGTSAGHLEYVGKVKSTSDGVASPTSVLLQDEVMGSWDSATPSPSQDGSRPRDSRKSMETVERKLCSRDVESSATSQSTSRSLVETLQTCLTSLPNSTKRVSTASVCQAWTNSSLASRKASGKTDRPGLAAAVACKAEPVDVTQISSLNHLTNSSHSVVATMTKVAKRRSRASRRIPTTVLNAEPSTFLDLVQRLTGIDAISNKKPELGVQPVVLRPQPRRPTSANNKQPVQGPNKTSQTDAPSVQAPSISQTESQLQNTNFTEQQIQPSCNSMHSSKYPFKGSPETNHVSGCYKQTLPPTSRIPPPPPPPQASISSQTGLMYQPEEVMAFLKTVNTSTTSADVSCHSSEHKLVKAIKPNRMEAVSFTSSTIQYESLDDNNNNTNLIKHSFYNTNRFEDYSTVTSDYLQKPSCCDQEEIDSWLMIPC